MKSREFINAMGRKGFTQKKLAAELGISRNTIGKAMRGHKIRPDIAFRISDALGVKPEEIELVY